MLEPGVVAGKRHPKRVALGRGVVLAALTRAKGRLTRTLTLTFDILSIDHARAGIGHPVCAAHGSPDHGAGSVSSSSSSLSGAHGLEALVVAGNLLPKRVAL